MNKVKLIVRGGIAYLVQKPKGIEVEIVDYDHVPETIDHYDINEEINEKHEEE